MINMSECFNMIGQDGCMDVATSLGMQGIDPEMGSFSIPIYEVLYIKFLIGNDCGFICGSIPEYSAIKKLNESCGTVAITLNVADIDLLTLLGGLLTFTPNTGFNVFLKLSAIDLLDETADILKMCIDACTDIIPMPIPYGLYDSQDEMLHFLGDILEMIFNMAIELIDKDMGEHGVNIREWDELPDFYNEVKNSGELQQMREFRNAVGAFMM